jgi:uncharacterized protein YndB with AHSA1/START domain
METTMTQRTVQHGTFVIEKALRHPPAKVFAAFADADAKKKWFGGPDGWTQGERSLDFREGGHEVDVGGPPGQWTSRFDCTYNEIIPDERIVYTYEMQIDGVRISVSVATIEFRPDGAGTKLVLTELGVYLDGHAAEGHAGREHGTRWLIDKLEASLDA